MTVFDPAVGPIPAVMPRRSRLLARWRRRVLRKRAPRGTWPALVPGLRIVWTPGIVVSGLRERLRPLGLDTPALLQGCLRELHVRLRPGTSSTYETACPACGKRCLRLWWSPVGFRGRCCVDYAQHGPLCRGGRWPCDRHQTPQLERLAAEYVLACRLGAARCAERRRRRVAYRVARSIPRAFTITAAARLARIAAAMAIPAPRRSEAYHQAPGPIAAALGLEIARLLIRHTFGIDAYYARVCRELVAGFPSGRNAPVPLAVAAHGGAVACMGGRQPGTRSG